MDTDFPAAHSMDTTWFAIDRDGRVACFESGEAGAVPFNAVPLEHGSAFAQGLQRLPRISQVIYDLRGQRLSTREGHSHVHVWQNQANLGGVLMFLDSLDPVADVIASGQATPVAGTTPAAVVFRDMTADLYARLHDGGLCQSCFHHYEEEEEEEHSVNYATRGLYTYGHLTENWISGPYGRERIPATPLHVDQLPPQLRHELRSSQFDLSFAEAVHIQPMNHDECVSWESAWLDLDGKTVRPMPERVNEFDEVRRDLASMNPNLLFDPPAPREPDESEQRQE